MILFNRCIRQNANAVKKFFSTESNLIGRDIITPEHLSKADIEKILWTALDFKSNPPKLKPLLSKHVSFIFREPNLKLQAPLEQAARLLGADCTTHFRPNLGGRNFDHDMTDSGRLVSCLTDTAVVVGLSQQQMAQFADGSCVPTITGSSGMFALVRALSDLMTLFENIGPLRRRTLAWVGPPTSLCNSLLCLAPKVGLNMRTCIICAQGTGGMSALKTKVGLSLCYGSEAELHEFRSPEEAIYRADIIMTGRHNVASHKITHQLLKEASLQWVFLHNLPRTNVEVEQNIFMHKNNLTWKSIENHKFIAMALLTNVLQTYELLSAKPDFDGPL